MSELPHIYQIKDALIEAAEIDILPRFKKLNQNDIFEKSPNDMVTIADIDAEKRLSKILLRLLPDSLVVGEEAYHKNPDIIKHINDNNYIWLVDPVDGTNNFVAGKPTFCVMVALLFKGKTIMACIYDPMGKNTIFAEDGNGAYFNDIAIKTMGDIPLNHMVGNVNLSLFPSEKYDSIKSMLKNDFKDINSLHCAGLDFVNQAIGRRHFSLYRRLYNWDHAPGALILTEAGGYVAPIDGSEYKAENRISGLLSAANIDIWNILKEKFKDAI